MTESARRRRVGDHAEVPPLLDDVVVVLHEPQNVVNVAAVIRAMKNMGLSRLRLVRPAEFDPYRIEGIAHRSEDVVEAVEMFDTLAEALADVTWVVGTSARARTANRNYLRPREAAAGLVERARAGTVALVFGREDKGLSNEDLDLCHAVAVIPTAPEYWSLNLAQAFLVLAYEVFLEAGGTERPLPRGRRATEPATREDLESMYAALEDGLAALDFFKGSRRPAAVMRTLRTVLGRSELDVRESRLVRAIGFEMRHFLERKGVAADAQEEGG
ncbi:MAG: RNA methyltransferase [Gemmatimonadetes bacterium]|nr:RNA methyltransferase [Gemmatimonadota bacterium]